MIYILEYNDQTFQYHYNNLDKSGLHFQSELFTNGWNPICIVSNDLYMDNNFDTFTNWVKDNKHSYQDAYRLINMWVINWMNGKKIKIQEK